MLFSRYGTFTGGIDLPDEKDRTLSLPIRRAPALSRLRVPLAPCGGTPARPVISPGTRVSAGERIAAAEDASAVDVFAPLAGRVVGLTTAAVAGRYGPAVSAAIELADLAEPELLRPAEETYEWRRADEDSLRARVGEGHLTTYRRGVEPMSSLLARARRKACRTLIANVMEGEPFLTADHRLLVEHGEEVVRGLAILARAMGARRVLLVADRRRTESYRHTVGPARMYGISQVALTHKYPTGADVMLVKVLLRREVPPGGSVLDVGAVCVSAADCFALYRWVACGLRPGWRVVTVSGERADDPGNFCLPFGVTCTDLVPSAEPPVIHGGPMTGLKCSADLVTGPATRGILAVEAAPAPVPGPCIRCAWCRDHCPTRLNVSAMNDAFELSDFREAARLGAMACIECGVCSFICPARLPLTQRMKQLKRAIGTGLASPADRERGKGGAA